MERKKIKARNSRKAGENAAENENVFVFVLFLIRERARDIYGNIARESGLSDRIIINGNRCIFHAVLRGLLRCAKNQRCEWMNACVIEIVITRHS